MNVTIRSGRITKDPGTKYTANGLCWTSFSVAVDIPGKDKGASFINCKAFDKTAETIDKNGLKGRLIGIVGHIQTGSYTAKDGHKVYTTDIIVDRVDFYDKKPEIKPDEIDRQAAVEPTQIEGFTALTDDDIPF